MDNRYVSPTILHAGLVTAAYNNDMPSLLRFLPFADPNEALRVAAGRGHHEIVQLLLSDVRSDPSARNNEAFRLACAADSVETIAMLLADPRVDPTACNSEALRSSVCRGERATKTVALLLRDGRVDLKAGNHAAFRNAPRGLMLNFIMAAATERGIHYGVLE